jgi:hypothetical protein
MVAKMGKMACKYCGEYIEKDSRFCYFCGSSVGTDKVPIDEKEPQKEDMYTHTIDTAPTQKVGKRKVKRKAVSGVIVAVVIIAALGVILPVTFISIYGPLNYRYIGSINYNSDVIITSNASLTIYNFAGDIDVDYNPLMTDAIKAEIFVYGRSEANISEALTFSVITNGNTSEFTFIDDSDYTFWDKTAMRYNLEIEINPVIDFAFDIEAFSGNIDLNLDSPSTGDITEIKLESFSGNINADFGLSKDITTPTFYVYTSSGNIDLQFGTNVVINTDYFYVKAFSGNVKINFLGVNELIVNGQIDIGASSGRTIFDYDAGILNAVDMIINSYSGNVVLLFGSSAEITLNEITIDVSSGNVEIGCDLNSFYSNISWNIMGFSGNVDIYLDPIIEPSINYTADFFVEVSSGNIGVMYGFSETEVGVQVTAATSSGDIDIPSGSSYYQSADFALKMKQYIFDLETFSGNIDVYNF